MPRNSSASRRSSYTNGPGRLLRHSLSMERNNRPHQASNPHTRFIKSLQLRRRGLRAPRCSRRGRAARFRGAPVRRSVLVAGCGAERARPLHATLRRGRPPRRSRRPRPEKHAVAVRPVSRVADRPMTVLHLEAVELEDQHTVRDEALVLPATVGALAHPSSRWYHWLLASTSVTAIRGWGRIRLSYHGARRPGLRTERRSSHGHGLRRDGHFVAGSGRAAWPT